jgi:hypothetical protein
MPILSGLRRQFANSTYEQSLTDCADETLISDARSGMRPMQIVENKLGIAMLREHERQDRFPQTSRLRFQ